MTVTDIKETKEASRKAGMLLLFVLKLAYQRAA